MPIGPIGVLGGTFDPIHYGHLRLAEELGEALKLDEVRFIPAGTPPHRGAPQGDAAHRLEMVRLATAGNPRFAVDDREVRRAGPGYTYDTLAGLRACRRWHLRGMSKGWAARMSRWYFARPHSRESTRWPSLRWQLLRSSRGHAASFGGQGWRCRC